VSARAVLRFTVGGYLLLFFLYLFGPLLVMSTTAFNSPSYPQAYPWQSATWRWFDALFADADMMRGLGNSVAIGIGVVCFSVPVGLAGAIVMTQIYARARALYYVVVVSPVLTPGVILGISTIVFWDRFASAIHAGYNSVFYNGFVLTVLGQSSFISAYSMLIILARLQRFDRAQEEAALDLGAGFTQVFRHILMPYLRPALFSASVLAFLSSFENYNTTTFTILAKTTLTTVLAGRIRQGMTPALSALAVCIILITLAGAVVYEILKRQEDLRASQRARTARLAEEQGMAAVAQLA
jgi:spermidine/putrescine transport system permease protein